MEGQNAITQAETIRGIEEGRAEVPKRGLVITFLALSSTGAVYLLWPESANRFVGLVWIFSLIPIFLLSYYRGWRGTAYAALATMAAFATAETISLYVFDQKIEWWLYGVVVLLLLVISLFVGWLSNRLIRERREAIRMAFRDALTQLPSRRALEFFLIKQVEAAYRGKQFCIVMFDLDDFKQFNDTYGHNAGDEILERVGEVFNEYGREGDLTGRYGGEEFLTVLPDEDEQDAKTFAERIRAQIAGLDMSFQETPTISAGVACWTDDVGGKEELVDRADEALYHAKSTGGNRVETWSNVTDT